ncbi:hypothetical protein D0O09_31690 [Pseudomonas putida]|nr:hypothetical protein D0O09_31690 [Pseudomonas putida]
MSRMGIGYRETPPVPQSFPKTRKTALLESGQVRRQKTHSLIWPKELIAKTPRIKEALAQQLDNVKCRL